MIPYPEIDPVAFALGPLKVHWYGIAYLLSFVAAWRLAILRSKKSWSPVKKEQVEDLIFYSALGVILGGRIGYVLFYKFGDFLQDPIGLFKVWEGGMSFHGGFLGVVCAAVFFARKYRIRFLVLADFVAPLAPVGLFLGRLGNFVGQELWGRPTEGWWAMVFPKDQLQLPRHPSQLYEAALEGVLLFVVLWWMSSKPRPAGLLGGSFLMGYGLLRFIVEFAREPDAHLANSLLFDWMTRGQVLCVPMIVAGGVLIYYALSQKQKNT